MNLLFVLFFRQHFFFLAQRAKKQYKCIVNWVMCLVPVLLVSCSNDGKTPEVEKERVTEPELSVEFDVNALQVSLDFTKVAGFTYSKIIRTTSEDCDPSKPDNCANKAELSVDTLPVLDTVSVDTNYYYHLVYFRNSDGAYSQEYVLYDKTQLDKSTVIESLQPYSTFKTDFSNTNNQGTIEFTNVHQNLTYEIYRSSDINCDWDNYATCENAALYVSNKAIDPATEKITYYYYLKTKHQDFYIADTATLTWSPEIATWTLASDNSPDWVNVAYTAVAVTDTHIYLLGGEQGHTLSESNDIYKFDGTTWTIVSDTPVWASRSRHVAINFGDKLWLIGGNLAGISSNNVFYSDHSDDGVNWLQNSAPSWTPRELSTLAVFKNELWLLGGESSSGCYNEIWRSPTGGSWFQQGFLPGLACSRMAHALFDDKLWIFGGIDKNDNPVKEIWSTEDGISWSEQSHSYWQERYEHQVAILDDYMLLIGGKNADGIINDIWLTEDGQVWHKVTSQTPWENPAGHNLLIFKNELYIIGASSQVWKTNEITWNAAF